MIAPYAMVASLLAIALVPPLAAQEMSAADKAAALQQIDASLPGTLINDPTTLDWRVVGDRLQVKPVFDPAIPGGGAAALYNVRKAGANPWDVQAFAPLTTDVTKGDVITYGFWARALDGVEGKVATRIHRDAEPWPGFADSQFTIGPDWQWFEASGVATTDISRAQAYLVFQLGAQKQQVEIGQTFVVRGADRILGSGARPAPPLPPQLEGRGSLISQPDLRDWSFQGPDGGRELREDGTIYLGRAARFTSPSPSDQPWTIQASVPLSQAIASGDELELAIAAKTVSASTEDGRAEVLVRLQRNSAPYDGFADNRFKVGPNWQLIRFKTTATMDIPAGQGVVALHFAGQQQVVDMGPVYVLKITPGS